jgi:hypothetical protein
MLPTRVEFDPHDVMRVVSVVNLREPMLGQLASWFARGRAHALDAYWSAALHHDPRTRHESGGACTSVVAWSRLNPG